MRFVCEQITDLASGGNVLLVAIVRVKGLYKVREGGSLLRPGDIAAKGRLDILSDAE